MWVGCVDPDEGVAEKVLLDDVSTPKALCVLYSTVLRNTITVTGRYMAGKTPAHREGWERGGLEPDGSQIGATSAGHFGHNHPPIRHGWRNGGREGEKGGRTATEFQSLYLMDR